MTTTPDAANSHLSARVPMPRTITPERIALAYLARVLMSDAQLPDWLGGRDVLERMRAHLLECAEQADDAKIAQLVGLLVGGAESCTPAANVIPLPKR